MKKKREIISDELVKELASEFTRSGKLTGEGGLMELFDRYMEIPKTAKRTSNAEATAMPAEDNAIPAAAVAPETTASTSSTTDPSNNENAVAPNDAVASSDSAPVAEVTNASSAEVS